MRLLACRTFATLGLASSSRWQGGPSLARSLSTASPSEPPSDILASDSEKRQPRSVAGPKSPRPPRPPSRPSRPSRTAPTDSVRSAKPSVAPRPPRSSAAEEAPSHGNRKRSLLQPYELSRRLITLCESGDVDLAVTTLQRAPRNAQNIKVWNTLVQQCMNAKKYKLAYKVFIDMKRRGFMPNVRTYATMMNGYATVENWEKNSKQLGVVYAVYAMLKQHLRQSDNLVDDPDSASFVRYPISLYISILGKAGKYQRAFDVFHQLDADGPLAPHPKVYSSLLSILADRVDSPNIEPEVITQTVSEATYAWRRHVRSLEKGQLDHIEPRSVEAIIKVLSRGESQDHELMFNILRDVCEFPRSSEDPPAPAPAPAPPSSSSPSPSPPPLALPKVAPTAWILAAALDGCIKAGHPDKAVDYAQSVMSSPKLRGILGPWHLRRLLFAHWLLAKAGSASSARAENAAEWVEWMIAQAQTKTKTKMQGHRGDEKPAPNEQTIATALELCHRCGDAESALRIARAATLQQGPMRGGSAMPARAWVYLVKLAIVTPGDEGKRGCLELLDAHGSVILDVWGSPSAIERLEPLEKRAHVSLANCIVQLLRTAAPSLPPDHEDAESVSEDAELGQHKPEVWSDLRRRAESFLENNHK